LSSLYVLKKLMETLDPEYPPQPCDVFDMIGGTSTGGLIALMLGRLGMTVEQCIDAYVRIMPFVFEKKKHRLSLSGKVQGRFNSEGLEAEVKKILQEYDFSSLEPLRNPSSKCKV
jgi:patatin-like phospholipase/acyl hydrolase